MGEEGGKQGEQKFAVVDPASTGVLDAISACGVADEVSKADEMATCME